MDSDEPQSANDNVVEDENVFSNDFTGDFENGFAENQPPISQQPPSIPPQQQQQQNPQHENRFAPNNNRGGGGGGRGKGQRGRGGGPPNNWNPHPQGAPPMQQELWVETKTGDNKSYFYHAVTRETTWNRPEGPNIKVMTQGEFEAYTRQQMAMRPPIEQRPDPIKDPKMSMMPPNMMEGPNTLLPPPTQHMPPFVPPFNANISPFGMHAPPHFNAPFPWQPPNDPAKIFDNRIDPKILAKAAEWTEHRAPDGRPYFYHSGRGESVWERPPALRELDEARAAFMHQQPPMTASQGSITFDSAGNMMKPGPLMNMKPQPDLEILEKERKRKEENDKAKQQPPKPQDKTRPISSTPISGTPWCVVWTGDSRVFFYNPSSRTSVWERPADLVGRADVDKAVNTVPEQLKSKDGKEDTQVSEKANNAGKKVESDKSAEEEEDDEEIDDEIPAKKSKVEEQIAAPVKIQNAPPIVEKKIDVIKDPAVEAELKAAKERAQIPLEVRVKQFKEMLKEKEVSAFSTWEKELHKIVFDQRYLLLASKERKQVFEKYVKDRAEDERREKRMKAQKKRDDFKTLMEDANLHSRSNFSDFCSRYSRDERYKGIEKMRERENLFNDFLSELRRREKDEKHQKKEQIRKEFFDLLKSSSDIDRHSHWMDVKKKLDQDPRYKAVSDSVLREDYFYEYIKILKEERKKEKSKKAKKSEKKEKKKKSKDKDRNKNESTTESKTNDESDKVEKESSEKGDESKAADMEIDDEDNKSEMDIDKSGGSDSEKDQEDGEHSGTDEDSESEKIRKDKERQQRAEASIKEREKQVQKTLAEHLRDRDKERQHHKRDEAIRNFTALLADLVRNNDLSWKEAKKQLKKDHRWESVEDLDRDERERLFTEHIHLLTKKKRDKFREMLEEIANLDLTTSWKDVKRQIRDDPRYSKFGNSEKCEREFRDYIRDKTATAKTEFKELLQECKLITHKSYDLYKENHNHLKEIEDILKNDKRYLVLDHISRERTDMILYYFEDLKKKGFPAPITQTVDNNRRKK